VLRLKGFRFLSEIIACLFGLYASLRNDTADVETLLPSAVVLSAGKSDTLWSKIALVTFRALLRKIS